MKKHTAIVTSVQRHAHDVVSVYFTLLNGETLKYDAGQYITVYFDNTATPQGKAYSLSSAPYEKTMSITVKKIGVYSGLLHNLRKGDVFTISDAYGFFSPQTNAPLVCIGAGVGIAPLWSVIKHECVNTERRAVSLLYSNKKRHEIPFKQEIEALSRACGYFSVTHHVTQDVATHGAKQYRISPDDCLQEAANDTMYLICGSADFVRSLWQGLTARGVAPEAISTETFFEQ